MSRYNMVNISVDPDREDDLFAAEVDSVKQWWSSPRWQYTRRPYSAEQIVSMRGHLNINYASNEQAKKLWRILEQRYQV